MCSRLNGEGAARWSGENAPDSTSDFRRSSETEYVLSARHDDAVKRDSVAFNNKVKREIQEAVRDFCPSDQ